MYRHPVSGESIKFGEHVSWKIQFAIRRWSFIGSIALITLACVILGTFDVTVIVWWNVWASFMALVIESVVGMAMFNMARNDGRVLRESHTLLEQQQTLLGQQQNLLERVEYLISELQIVAHKDAGHSERDYAVDLETNELIKQILKKLGE